MLESGKHIGNYILVRKLGAGGFGEVWQAEKHTKLSVSNFALKFFRPKEGDEVNLDKEKREIGIWQKVSGLPNIISIIEADEFEEYIYVVSEFADGGSLEKQMSANSGKPFPVNQAITTILEILSGLNSLHQMSFVHRDIKPANILIRRGVYCLADFGISREMKAHSKATQTAGTYEYMSPESFENKPVTIHSDIWAVGAIFQQLLTGNLPFPQKEIPSLIYAILHGEPVKMPSSIPEGIQKVVITALEKDPQNRYSSAMEMMNALKYQQMLLNNPEWRTSSKSSQETVVLEDNFRTQRLDPGPSDNAESKRITQESHSVPVTEKTQYVNNVSLAEKTQYINNVPLTEKTQYSGNFEIPSISEANSKKSNRSMIFALAGGGGLLVLLLAIGGLAFAFKDRIFSSNSASDNTAVSTANSSPKPDNTKAAANTNQDAQTEVANSTNENKNSAKTESSPEAKSSPESATIAVSKPTTEVKRKEPAQQTTATRQRPTPVPVKQHTPKPETKKKNSDCIFTGDC